MNFPTAMWAVIGTPSFVQLILTQLICSNPSWQLESNEAKIIGFPKIHTVVTQNCITGGDVKIEIR
jgi:hypothetical protein